MLSCNGIFYVVLVIKKNVVPLQCKKIARSGAVVARWAHNPKVVSSNLASATIPKADFRISESAFSNRLTGLFFFEEIFSNPSLKCEGVGDYFFNSAIEDIVVIALTNIVANLL